MQSAPNVAIMAAVRCRGRGNAIVGALAALGLTAALAGAGPAGAAPGATPPRAPGAQAILTSDAAQSPPAVPVPPVPPGAHRAGGTKNSQVYPGGGIFSYGSAAAEADPLAGVQLNAPVVGVASAPGGTGFWLASADGGVYTIGGAPYYGSMGGTQLTGPVVGIAATPAGGGYWLVGIDGGIFTFGNAAFYGSMGGEHLNQPIVGMAATPTGGGYWEVAADGGIFTFGNAAFYGSMGGEHLNQPIVGMAATPTGGGYWEVAADGGIFTFGNATFDGSLGGRTLQSGISAMAATPRGNGYWLLEWNGAVFNFGTASTWGEPTGSPAAAPFRAIVPTATGGGYWLLEPDGFSYSFNNPAPTGGNAAIVQAAASQVQPDPDEGYFCNPYGACEPWCALFATWAWQQGGVGIPSYGFVGYIYDWAAANGQVLPPGGKAVAGDAILYGTGPQSGSTAVHVGIVAQVWPDGAVDTIEGDAGPGVTGHLAVVVNQPFLPTDAQAFGNYPVFAIAQP